MLLTGRQLDTKGVGNHKGGHSLTTSVGFTAFPVPEERDNSQRQRVSHSAKSRRG